MNPEHHLLVLTAPPALEEALIDWLLEHGEGAGFTTQPVSGHSSRHGQLSLAEQVSGRQRRVQFQVHAGSERIEHLLQGLRRDFNGSDVHYWVAPLVMSGHLEG
ncbi:hypothetical protein TspCOW1_29240 [Thiohalobacter sp. COW1]|uniref:DUF3240 family protein n=1 Tax=Thiohalobacter sp. COW1 TaxID=2795687 RepID=UPI0019159C34|nr:DUF3240 family protein [Thiohalobacter sp. COW1]BCO32821.1 hypothetical protein TspCOW1_29240 [Thiohalobacter sp. COW1]